MNIFGMKYVLFLGIVVMVFASCSTAGKDERLVEVSNTIDRSPKAALSMLDTIDYHGLSDGNRHYFDFLLIKAKDKHSVKHTSDSLILDVIKHFEGDDDVYTEALYYGGRVYSDLGDTPTALKFFNLALQQMSEQTADIDLLCRVLSQKGWILANLSLFDEAIPCLESVLEMDYPTNDSTNIFADLQALGATLIRAHKYDRAETTLRRAIDYSTSMSCSDEADCKMYLAWAKHQLGQTDSALHYIRGIIDKVSPMERNSVCGYACRIYLKAGILDTAYIYARTLVASPDTVNQDVGYHVILSPQLRGYIEQDTLDQYISDYERVLYARYNHSQLEKSIRQESQYNYQWHENERSKIQKANARLWGWIVGLLILVLLLTAGGIWMARWHENKEKMYAIKLQQSLRCIENLKSGLSQPVSATIGDNDSSVTDQEVECLPSKSAKELRDELKRKVLSISENNDLDSGVSPVILQSEVYSRIMKAIEAGKVKNDNDPIWHDLEETILQISPNFLSNLRLLCMHDLSIRDIHISMLYKCGIKPSQMLTIFGVSNGAIVYRRRSLSKKLFGETFDSNVIGAVMRLL